MKIIVEKPNNIDKGILDQFVDLVDSGEQVQKKFIVRGVNRAELIALFIDSDEVIAAAALKNPLPSYRNGVFKLAGVENEDVNTFTKELGYIVTKPKYEGRKYCQKALLALFDNIGDTRMFATTRKPSMAYILRKFGFEKLGNTYKSDLELFTFIGDRKNKLSSM